MPAKGSKKAYCVRGHHKPTVGAAPNGWCLKCREESYARRGRKVKERPDRGAVKFRSPLCPAGHDKRIVGVGKHYECLECRRIRCAQTDWRAYRRQLNSRRAGLPEGIVLSRWTELPKLRELRLRAGYTQKEMARVIGVTHKHYGQLELGHKRALRSTVAKVMAAIASAAPGRGKLRRVIEALAEAERRGEPTAAKAAEILGLHPSQVGASLRWLAAIGLAERFENERGVFWLVTERRAA
jgi:DNA-binding XRE family transcriptional regulator